MVLIAFPTLLRFVKVRSYQSAEQACRIVWSMWLSPREPNRPLASDAFAMLRDAEFVRGFVDGVAGVPLSSNEQRPVTSNEVRG